MTRRMRKNQNWNPSDVGRSPAEVGARTGQVGVRMPWGINPAQLAAQSYVKTPMQLAGSALARRAERAAQPFGDAMSAIGELGSNIGRTGYNVLRDSSRAYFDNADDYGNLRSFDPVVRAGKRAYSQNMPAVRDSARRASESVVNAYPTARDYLGGLVDYGTSAGYAMGRGGRRVGGGIYRGIRDAVRPFLGEEEPGDTPSPSMRKRGKSVKKNVGKKIRQGLINSVARGRIGAQALAATTGHMIPLLLANPRKAKGIVGQHARIAARDMNVDNFFNREGISNYGRQKALLQEYKNPRSVGGAFMGGVKASKVNMNRVAQRYLNAKQIDQLSPIVAALGGATLAGALASRYANNNPAKGGGSTKKSLNKRQAGPKPNKYF